MLDLLPTFRFAIAALCMALAPGFSPAVENESAKGSGGSGGKVGTLSSEEIEVGQTKRAYRLVVPKDLRTDKPIPLVVAFHGAWDSKDIMPWYSELDKFAEKENFILIFPNGIARMWPYLPDKAAADIELFDALYAMAIKSYNIDLDRVYLVGMSNGAYFAHIVAANRPEKIAAVASHSGGLGFYADKEIKVSPKYAVFVIHGEKDSLVPLEEGRQTRDSYKKWGHEVEYLEVPGWDHWWAVKADVNAKIWKFFQDHPRKTGEK